ncbi:MAG: ATP-binding protein [Myxococcota bacterium]
MQAPPLPEDEPERQAELDAYQVVDTPPEPAFEDIVYLAQSICEVPIVLVSLIDRNRQWFKACIGLDVRETERNISFCGHALLLGQPLVVGDAGADLRFADNPLVTGPPHIRFYAGFQLLTPAGQALGTLCVIDRKPRELSPEQLDAMARLAKQVVGNLELRRKTRELEKARARAEALAQSRAEFLATMSHEIRTPMNGVLGLAELLCDAELEGEPAKLARTIHDCGLSLVEILNDILDLSKLEAGRFRLYETPFEVHGLTELVSSVFHGAIKEKGLTLQLDVEDGVAPRYMGDVNRISQVLNNLMSNAIKFTESGSVGLRVRLGDKGVRFIVWDSGEGIPPDALERLFRPFEQMGPVASGLKGTGLGLSICRRLIGLMGGEIGCESELGEGSCFWFELPLEPRPPGTEDTDSTFDLKGDEKVPLGLSVLVADDNKVNLKVVHGMLDKLGCRAVLVENGAEALKALEDGAFDVVLLDLQMPEVDGLETARRIRGDARFAELPLVALTASAMSEDRDRSVEAGMNAFLSKPLILQDLEQTLGEMVRAPVSGA